MNRVVAQTKTEIMLIVRNGEQLLLTLVIPVLLLVFFGTVDVLPTQDLASVDFLLPGVLALAIMSTAMVSLGIATGFERSYLVLKRLGATPLTRGELVAAKTLSVFAVELVQLLALVSVGLALGWRATGFDVVPTLCAVLLGTSAFAGVGIFLAGQLRAEVNLAAQNGLYLILLLLGGMVIPRDSLPGFLDAISSILPSSALSSVLRSAMTEGRSIVGPICVLVAWALCAPLVASRRFRWT